MRIKIWALLFLFAITFYSFRLSFAFMHYALFNENFTELYCINKDKPEMECNGRCHLQKKVKENASSNSSNYNYLSEELHQLINLYCESVFDFDCNIVFFSFSQQGNFRYNNLYDPINIEQSFIPPDRLS